MQDGMPEFLGGMWMGGLLLVTVGSAWMFGFAGSLLAAGVVFVATAVASFAADITRRPR